MPLFANRLIRAALPHRSAFRGFASVGDQLPGVELHLGFPPKKHNLAAFAKDKSILLVGLPGGKRCVDGAAALTCCRRSDFLNAARFPLFL